MYVYTHKRTRRYMHIWWKTKAKFIAENNSDMNREKLEMKDISKWATDMGLFSIEVIAKAIRADKIA